MVLWVGGSPTPWVQEVLPVAVESQVKLDVLLGVHTLDEFLEGDGFWLGEGLWSGEYVRALVVAGSNFVPVEAEVAVRIGSLATLVDGTSFSPETVLLTTTSLIIEEGHSKSQ